MVNPTLRREAANYALQRLLAERLGDTPLGGYVSALVADDLAPGEADESDILPQLVAAVRQVMESPVAATLPAPPTKVDEVINEALGWMTCAACGSSHPDDQACEECLDAAQRRRRHEEDNAEAASEALDDEEDARQYILGGLRGQYVLDPAHLRLITGWSATQANRFMEQVAEEFHAEQPPVESAVATGTPEEAKTAARIYVLSCLDAGRSIDRMYIRDVTGWPGAQANQFILSLQDEFRTAKRLQEKDDHRRAGMQGLLAAIEEIDPDEEEPDEPPAPKQTGPGSYGVKRGTPEYTALHSQRIREARARKAAEKAAQEPEPSRIVKVGE